MDVRYAPKTTSRFQSVNEMARFILFPFTIRSLSVHIPFNLLLKSVHIFRPFQIRFIFVPCSRSACTWQFMIFIADYRVCMPASSLCVVGRKIVIVLPIQYG